MKRPETLTVLGMTAVLALILFTSFPSLAVADANAPLGITDTPTPTPTFTPTPTYTPTPITEAVPPPVVPEASTLILLGSAVSGLAGYIGLQVRARRG